MKISIVIPTLNRARYLPSCLESVLSQTGNFELEVLVRDGGSTDGSVEILERLAAKDPRLRYASGADRGQTHAINEGWAEATGDVLAWLNSDDLYLSGALQAVVDSFRADTACLWLCGRCRIIDESGRPARRFIGAYKEFLLSPWRPTKLLFENTIPQPAVFLRREAIREAGPLDESLHYAMDYDYWLRLARTHSLKIIPTQLACYRMHRASKTGGSIGPSFREAHRVARRHAIEWGKPWASWVNFWFYYVRTSIAYHILKLF